MNEDLKAVDAGAPAGEGFLHASERVQEAADHPSPRSAPGEDAETFFAAARHIGGSASSDEGGASREERWELELGAIARWAERFGIRHYLDAELPEIPLISNQTSEHEVRLLAGVDRVLKKTWAGVFGQVPYFAHGRLERRVALPSEYLFRQGLQNEVFGSDLRLEGISISTGPSMIIGQQSGQPSFVVSQRFIRAADRLNPNPEPSQIDEFLEEHGFVKIRGSYFGWYRAEDGVAIVDARPDNFVLAVEGVIPIDLQMALIEDDDDIGAFYFPRE